MKPTVLDNIPFRIAVEDVAPQLHVEPDTEDWDALGRLVEQAAALARPKAIFTTSYIEERGPGFVEIGGVRWESRVMCDNLKDVHRAFPYVATCGTEVERWAEGIADMVESWWADITMVHVLGKAIQHLNAHLRDSLKLGKIANMNPGSLPDWPITEQPRLFSLLGDVEAAVGVRLTESMLMVPRKSVSGLYFQNDADYANCELCTREGCPGRRKPFDAEKHRALALQAQ